MPVLAGFAFGGSSAPVDHTIPIAPDTSGNYTVAGTLTQTFTSSGTYTPGAGVTKVNVVVIGGGGNGAYDGGGGGGGGVRVYQNVPVSGSVSVTVGGTATASSFGSLSAPGGRSVSSNAMGGAWSVNFNGKGAGATGNLTNGFTGFRAADGPTVNGTYYAGGGSAYGYTGWMTAGLGGGGVNSANSGNGTDGLGGGGCSRNGAIPNARGGTGRVMVYVP